MTIDWRSFKKDPYFFLKYFFLQMATSVALFAGISLWRDPLSEVIAFKPWHLPAMAIAVLLGVQVPALLHNAVHNNLKPRWLNDIVGEIAGFFVLFGLGPFRISHFLHHAFADSKRDPHPPNGKGFIFFLATTQLNTIKVIRRMFLDIHGESLKTHAVLAVEMAFYYVSLVARLLCWYSLLGPTLFLAVYLPAYVTNVLVFAHINFATHKTLPDGSVEIVNLDHNPYYRFVNFVGSGVYYHKSHHDSPTLLNPKTGRAGRCAS